MSGKYISREALRSRVDEIIKTNHLRPDYVWFTPHGVKALALEIPAADVVEVRHGRWIKDGEDGPVYCSECGEEHEWEDYRASYCDACGAKMDGGQDDV